MTRKRSRMRNKNSIAIVPREEPYVPKPGPGQVFVQEGERESRHYRNVGNHPLDLALERGQISAELHAAGNTYRVMFEKLGRSGIDTTQIMQTGGGGAQSVPFTDAQVDAIRAMQQIEKVMPKRCHRIVRRFCGEGYAMAEAVMQVTPCHPSNVTPCHHSNVKYRIIEALEGLDDALDQLRVRRVS
jgi:hypothetical protein